MTFKRDFGFVYCLSKVLEKLNCEIYVCSNTDYLGWPMRLWKPDVIFFVTHGRMERIAKRFPEAKLVLWNAESCRLDTDDPVEMQIAANETDYKNMGKVLLWGQGAKDIILNKAKKENWHWVTNDIETFDRKFVVVGHPRLDLAKYGKTERRQNDAIKIGVIGLCSGINNVKHTTVELLLDAYDTEGTIDRVGDFHFEAQYFDLIAKLMHQLDNKKYEFNIRPYFLENLENYYTANVVKSGRLKIDDSIEFSSWVKSQDIIIGAVSTTMYLVAAAEKSYINVDRLFQRPMAARVFSEEYLAGIPDYCPKTYDEFMDMVLNYEKHKLTFNASEILSQQRKHYLSSEGSLPVLYQMAEGIISLADGTSGKMGLPTGMCNFLNSIRKRYAEFRGLKRGLTFDYSHFDREVVMPKAEREFSLTVDAIMDKVNKNNREVKTDE